MKITRFRPLPRQLLGLRIGAGFDAPHIAAAKAPLSSFCLSRLASSRSSPFLLVPHSPSPGAPARTRSLSAPPLPLFHPSQQCRCKSTTARTKRALNIAPHLSFLTRDDPDRDVIVFNPPASEPSVHNTPFKFLPKCDPRRSLNLSRLMRGEEGSGDDSGLPPGLPRTFKNSWANTSGARYDVTFEQAMEIKQLRRNDPHTWTVQKLAEKFSCSPRFVIMCAGTTSEDYRAGLDAQLDRIKSGWGPRRTKAREERTRRRKMLFDGEL